MFRCLSKYGNSVMKAIINETAAIWNMIFRLICLSCIKLVPSSIWLNFNKAKKMRKTTLSMGTNQIPVIPANCPETKLPRQTPSHAWCNIKNLPSLGNIICVYNSKMLIIRNVQVILTVLSNLYIVRLLFKVASSSNFYKQFLRPLSKRKLHSFMASTSLSNRYSMLLWRSVAFLTLNYNFYKTD